ncbi:MAG: cell wall-active antibiotics response protein [Bacteroidetes bacterium]|nr:cell wall-active antibiotics response protein [Bacteroidota bacterium]MCL2301767.1 cell wall-active antibiotics response protein [Lentimicrobiaceae bacterium]
MENQKHEKSFTNHSKQFQNSRKNNIAFWSIVLVVVLFFFLKKSGLIASVYLSAFCTWPLILFCISVLCLFCREWVAGIIFLAGAAFFWTPIFLKADPNLIPGIVAKGFIGNYWYLLVIFIAITIILQQVFKKESSKEKGCGWRKFESNIHECKDGFIRSEVLFSSNERIYLNENFKGGKFDTLFGAQEIDLRRCIIPDNGKALIDISLIFGSCVIWVPAEWTVQVNTQSILSALEDKRLQNSSSSENDMLVINGKCIFASLEIRN